MRRVLLVCFLLMVFAVPVMASSSFDAAQGFSEGLAAVKIGDRWG